MEEEKAAAYYDELTRKGSGAARFKQGLGFSSNAAAPPPSTTFVKAGTLDTQSHLQTQTQNHNQNQLHKQAQLHSIQNKLKSKSTHTNSKHQTPSRSRSRSRDNRSGSRDEDLRTRSRSRSRDSNSKHTSRRRSTSRERNSRSRSRSRDRYSRRRRSRERNSKHKSRSRSRSEDRYSRRRSRERSSRRRSRSRSRGDQGREKRRGEKRVKSVDYAKLIHGYDSMAPAERVKAKMKLQLTETAKRDPTRGTGSGWERFDFDKDATLDDEEIEAADDDSSLVKHIGQSFRFSAVEARKEDQIKAAHDEAMFGAPSLQLTSEIDEEKEDSPKCTVDSAPDTSLISNQVISMQQVSWRDRVKKM